MVSVPKCATNIEYRNMQFMNGRMYVRGTMRDALGIAW